MVLEYALLRLPANRLRMPPPWLAVTPARGATPAGWLPDPVACWCLSRATSVSPSANVPPDMALASSLTPSCPRTTSATSALALTNWTVPWSQSTFTHPLTLWLHPPWSLRPRSQVSIQRGFWNNYYEFVWSHVDACCTTLCDCWRSKCLCIWSECTSGGGNVVQYEGFVSHSALLILTSNGLSTFVWSVCSNSTMLRSGPHQSRGPVQQLPRDRDWLPSLPHPQHHCAEHHLRGHDGPQRPH